MKQLIIILALSLFTISVFADDINQPQDTIIRTVVTETVTDTVTGLVTTTRTETEKIIPTVVEPESSVMYDGSSYNFIFSWKKKKHLSPHWTGIGMGFMNYDDIPNGRLKMSTSHNFTVNLVDFHKQIKNSNWLLVSGIGSEWSRYHFDDNSALTKRNGITVFEPAPEGVNYKATQLIAYYVTIPLLLEYQTSDFHISGGVVGFLKYYSKSQVKFKDDEGTHKVSMGQDLNIRPVDMRFRLQVGINNVGVYGYYAPFSMFSKDKGPDLKTYTIGVMIGI
ncbi:MAG: hypothetical protein ACK5KN_12395 [Dysgonomonas sp.]|jgi:hypothetical protein|uniref:hypothetical protein n=1 Tax=unclassified Dysgonomonas TaxID=2630389 RepID=UPI0025BCA1EB|nr:MULTISPECIES: hypothetical protein [unclassified Dysgonomonas]MDR2003899.1 hypothetical protein [Prevotella sp.]HMM03799.1 hypothetical protein [Dysgonomonas sp.]